MLIDKVVGCVDIHPRSGKPKIPRPAENMLGTSVSSPTSPIKRACDACHRRKVRCIGGGTCPCKNCAAAGLTCTYNAVPQRKGPKGSRAKVISELRETQRQSQDPAQRQSVDFEGQAQIPTNLRTTGLLSMDMIHACVEYYFANVYPTQPILHRRKIGETIDLMETNIEAYCMVVSLCAYMMIQPNMAIPVGSSERLPSGPQPSMEMGHILLREAVDARKRYDYVEAPTVRSVITSFFFFGAYFCLDKQNTAWFHLREATTLAQILGMQDESHYNTIPDIIESSRRRRLYWLLFVTERAYALQQRKPLTLHATIHLPTLDEDPTEKVELNGFLHLVRLFRPFDDTFIRVFNDARPGVTADWLGELQQQLAEALPVYLQSTESQAVDLRCSQQWLRTMVWQLSVSHGFLSSAATENALSFKFPIEVSRDLVACTSQFSRQAMEVHGIGLIEKLFDVACALTDVMACVPLEEHKFELGPRDYLHQLMSLISTLRGGRQRYLPVLLEKINDTVPCMLSGGYGMPRLPAYSRVEELYDSSQSHSTPSDESTPFGSPPTSATSTTFGFQELSLHQLPLSPAFSTSMASGAQYDALAMAAPMLQQMIHDHTAHGYSGPAIPKWEF